MLSNLFCILKEIRQFLKLSSQSFLASQILNMMSCFSNTEYDGILSYGPDIEAYKFNLITVIFSIIYNIVQYNSEEMPGNYFILPVLGLNIRMNKLYMLVQLTFLNSSWTCIP